MLLPAGGARTGGRTRTSRRGQRETYFPDVERPKHRLPCSSFLLHLPSKPQNPGRSKQPTMLRRKDIAQERLSGRRGWAPFKSMFRICLCFQVCVRGTCSVLGRDCPYSWFRPLADFSIRLSCANLTNTDLKVGFFILRNYSVDTFQVICHVIFFRWSGMTQLHFLRQTCLCPPCLHPPPPTAAQTPRPRPPSSRCWAPPASPPGGRSQTSANFATGLHGSMALARSADPE